MGIGNLTELTAADSTGVNALLDRHLPGAGDSRGADDGGDPVGARRGEGDRHCASADALRGHEANRPQGDGRSAGHREGPRGADVLRGQIFERCRPRITDPNYRIFADRDAITVFNSERFVRGTDIQEIFDQLEVDEPTHAFYLGKELAKASLAVSAWQDLSPGRRAVVGLSHTGRRASATPRAPDARSNGSARFDAPMLSVTPLVEEMSPAPDPVRCCEALEGLPYRLFLDSASTTSRLGRYSFLTADPVAIVRSRGVETECLDLRTGARREISGDPLVALRELVMPYAAEPVSGLPPFQGGAAGYVAYDWGLTLERLPGAALRRSRRCPMSSLGVYDWVHRVGSRRRRARG